MSTEKKDISGIKKPDEKQKAIKNAEEVRASVDGTVDEDFPGYPHYPSNEDILNPANNTERVDVDVENITRSSNHVRQQEKEELMNAQSKNTSSFDQLANEEDDLQIVPGTEADVTEEDLLILETTDGNIVRAKEEDIITTDSLSDINIDDLDITGTEMDDANEDIGEEDEENNYYSLGGEKEDLLEDDQQS